MGLLVTLVGARITGKELQKFDNGGQVVRVSLGGNTSFSLNPADPLLKKLAVGREIDLEAAGIRETQSQSGATFKTLIDPVVKDIRLGAVETQFKDLPDDDSVTPEREVHARAAKEASSEKVISSEDAEVVPE